MEKRQAIVYLCKSALLKEKDLQPVRDELQAGGFIVNEHEEGKEYNPKKL
jgi:hypothetical protein